MKVVFPGSFDPITLGHLDVIKRASLIFDEIIVLVANNSSKNNLFTLEKRVELIEKSLDEYNNITVEPLFEGLIVDYLHKHDLKIILRSVRTYKDFELETNLAYNNKVLAEDIETLYLNTSQSLSHINSSIVKDIFFNKGDVSQMVPESVLLEMERIK